MNSFTLIYGSIILILHLLLRKLDKQGAVHQKTMVPPSVYLLLGLLIINTLYGYVKHYEINYDGPCDLLCSLGGAFPQPDYISSLLSLHNFSYLFITLAFFALTYYLPSLSLKRFIFLQENIFWLLKLFFVLDPICEKTHLFEPTQETLYLLVALHLRIIILLQLYSPRLKYALPLVGFMLIYFLYMFYWSLFMIGSFKGVGINIEF